jgi:hypothetical protein
MNKNSRDEGSFHYISIICKWQNNLLRLTLTADLGVKLQIYNTLSNKLTSSIPTNRLVGPAVDEVG